MTEKIGDVDFYYERYGAGTPVIMIHGWSPDHRILKNCMEPMFRHFPGVFERLYLDLPGMGGTRGGDGIRSTDDMVDRIRAFIDKAIPGKKYLLVGESYGGYLARGLVRLESERVLGLCLVCPIAANETRKENAAPFSVLEKDPGIDSIMDDDDVKYYSDMSVRQTASTLLRFREEIMPGLKVADYEWIAGHFAKQASFMENVDDPSARYPFPALFLTGRQDSSVGYSDLWKILDIYPRATYCVLDMAGHNLQIEQPELFDALVREWLERVLVALKNPSIA